MDQFMSADSQQVITKEMPSFIKPAPTSTQSGSTAPTSPPAPIKKTGIALDSLEPVIVSGVGSSAGGATAASGATTATGPNPNNPSPQNFAGSAKGMDLLQGGDIQQPRGDPQFVGLTRLAYAGGQLPLFQSGTVDPCTPEDFQECFIEKTLHHYYKARGDKKGDFAQLQASPGKGGNAAVTENNLDSGGDSSPERTGTSKQRHNSLGGSQFPNLVDQSGGSRRGGGTAGALNRSIDGKGPKDERRTTNHLLQQAKRTPYDFCKVAFVITLPYEMLIEQIQIQLHAQDEQSQQAQGGSNRQSKKRRSAHTVNQLSNNPSHVGSVDSHAQQAIDNRFSANFKILNISTLKNPDQGAHGATLHSTDSRTKAAQLLPPKGSAARQQREHRHIAIKSAFSEEVTGKNSIEINACAVTKYLHVTLLCLRQDVSTIFQQWKQQQSFSSSRKSKTSAFEVNSKAQQASASAHQQDDPKISGAQRLIAEIEDFDILDEHDQEVAFISKQYQKENASSEAIVDHEQIALQLRGDDEEFDRDMYDEDLSHFKVGNIISNDEDDLRILDSLPHMVKPKGLQNSFNSKKQTSVKQPKSAKGDDQAQSTAKVGGPLARFIDKIVVYGFNCNSIPAITNLTYFMNQSFYMRKQKKYYQAEEVDYLVGTLMITTKRATQASEFYRKMQQSYIKKIHRNMAQLEKGRASEECSSNNATFIGESELRNETQNLFIQCAIFELLIADGLSFETQLNEKLQALARMVAFAEGQVPTQMRFAPQVLVSDDSFSAILRILPQLLRFCLLSLTHRREIVRMSALKVLKFILETQGCSLDASMIYILKGMFLTFPKANTPQAQAEKEAAEKLKKQSSDDSPSAKSVSTQKALEEPESATLKRQAEAQSKVKVVQSDFDLALLVGESEAATMTIADFVFHGSSRNSLLSNSNNMMQSDSHVIAVEPEQSIYATKFLSIQEPSSGFTVALQNVHSHVLETYISVLSSISSHILHRIFYDVIEDALCATPHDAPQRAVRHSASFKQNSYANVSGVRDTSSKLQGRVPMAQASQIKVYACKIAEKIITICQGDLNISPGLLTSLADGFSSSKPLPPLDSASAQAHAAMKNLWNSIKQKVFPNYSTKGYRKLVEWISLKLNHLMTSKKTHSQDLLNTKPVSQRAGAFPDELSDDENITLCQLCEVITIVTFNRLKQEEEANQLIKLPTPESFGNGASSEMYLLLPQLVFWLEYSIDREDRLQLFTQVYQTIKEVLESVPTNGRSRDNQLSVVQIVMPSLRRTNEFLKSNSPSLPMLKFLDIVLSDIQLCAHERKSKQQNLSLSPTQQQSRQQTATSPDNSVSDPLKLQAFFLELLENFVTSLAYSLYEEAFTVFDKLLYLAGEAISQTAIKKCIIALVDKYTLKSKSHKASTSAFMKTLMDVKVRRNQSPNISRHHNRLSNPGSPEIEELINENELSGHAQAGSYFEVMAEFCFFENVDTNYKLASREGAVRAIDDKHDHNNLGLPQLDFRGPMDVHELFVDKLQFFIDSLALMTEAHIGMFTYLITNHNFKNMLLQLLEHGETNVRMKAHEILEALTSYFVQCCPSKTVYEFPQGSSREMNQVPEAGKKMEAEFIAHERLYISQIVIQVAKKSLQQQHDCYLQFNALILLDFLFQNLLPVPTFQNEQVKARKQNRRASQQTPSAQEATDVELTMDIEVLSISDMTPELDVMDPAYLRMRMKLVLSLWPHIQAALASPWSNIRSICYGLVCSMLKINVADYPPLSEQQALSREIGTAAGANQLNPVTQFSNDRVHNTTNNNLSEIIGDQAALSDERGRDQFIMSDILSINVATQARLKEIILPMLYSLLSSKESESKAGGLNILGSFCGLSYDFTAVKINQNLAFLQRNSQFISLPIWRLVYQLQDDWDITIKEASVVLVQLCAPRSAILYFQSLKEKRQQKKLQYLMNQMPNVQSIYVKRGFHEAEDEEEKGVLRAIRPESRLSIKNYLVRRNEHATRAFMRFPNDADLEIILGKTTAAAKSPKHTAEKPDEASFSILQESTLVHEAFGDHNGNFSDYLSGKIPIQAPALVGGAHPHQQANAHELIFSQQAVSCQMIEQEHLILADKVLAFNPDFEDTRFVKNLSRRRQMEIELDLPGRGRKHNQTSLNFFVDTYSDEQIQEIISIFRNDFKPPKNLWIEKQPSPMSLVSGGMSNGALMSQAQQPSMRSQSPDYYQDIYAEAIEQFNQQQAQMQQQQQAQLQQQVQSGSTNSSRDSSALSQNSSQSSGSEPAQATSSQANPSASKPFALNPVGAASGITAESAATTAARLSPQPSGRMIDALEDDQLRKYAEEHQAKQIAKSQGGGSSNSANSHKSSGSAPLGSIEENAGSSEGAKQLNLGPADGVHAFGEMADEAGVQEVGGGRSGSGSAKDKQGVAPSGIWSPDTEALQMEQHKLAAQNVPLINGFVEDDNRGDRSYKSESMGLLDAESYKNLGESDSNSEGHDPEAEEMEHHHHVDPHFRGQPEQAIVYEMRPPAKTKRPRKVPGQTLKIEQLNFEGIQIYAQHQQQHPQMQNQVLQSQPKKIKPPKQLQVQNFIVEQPQAQTGPRLEFYQDPADLPQNQSSSRLGQRSSRLQLQEELNQKGSGGGPDDQAFVMAQRILQKLKSPTDKLLGRQGGVFKSFTASGPGSEAIHYNVGPAYEKEVGPRNKSNESRSRKRPGKQQIASSQPKGLGQKPGGSFQKGSGKLGHLVLKENDYFSSEDKHASNLRALTQKAVHHYQGGLAPWQWASNAAKVGGGPTAGHHSTRHRAKSIGTTNSVSTPDFSVITNKLGQKVQAPAMAQNSGGGSGPPPEGLEATSSQEMLDQKISRKMAQTYLSGLSRGFITNIDNIKLINTCLHQDQQSTAAGSTQGANVTKAASSFALSKSMVSGGTVGQSSGQAAHPKQQVKKIANKSFENLGAHAKLKPSSNHGSLLVDLQLQNPKSTMPYQTHRSNKGKNSTLSTSPKRRDGSQTTAGVGSSANYQRKQKSIEKGFGLGSKKGKQLHYHPQTSSDHKGLASATGSNKKGSSISDLHLFIKTIEKDLSEKFRNMKDLSSKGPATPKQILRKVEDQMRAFGLDPKSGSNQATAQALALKFAQSEQAAAAAQQPGSQQSQEKKRKKSLPPKLKLLGLTQVFHSQGGNAATQEINSANALFASGNQNVTPSNLSSNGSGSHPFMAKSHQNIHGGNQFSAGGGGGSTKKHKHRHADGEYHRSSGSRRRKRSGPRDRSAESRTSRQRTKSGRLSTGRGASSGSGGRGGAISHQVPHPPMVMTERCLRPARPATGGKQAYERASATHQTAHPKNSKSLTKGGGSALAKTSKPSLHKMAKQQVFSPTQGGGSSQLPPPQQLQANQQQPQAGRRGSGGGNQKPSATAKQPLSKGAGGGHKGTSLSAMNQIATNLQADQQLLQQILQGTGGSTSVRNSDYNSRLTGAKGTGPHLANPFLLGKSAATQKTTPGSTKGSQTNRFQGNLSNNILFELIQNQHQENAAQQHQPQHQQMPSKKQKVAAKEANLTQNLRQSGSQSSRTTSNQATFNTNQQPPIKMIKNKKQRANQHD